MTKIKKGKLRNDSALFLQGWCGNDLHARDILELLYAVDIV